MKTPPAPSAEGTSRTSRRHEMPFTRLEVIVLSLKDGALSVLLGKREGAPYEGQWAIPGGVLRIDLDTGLDEAAARVATERLGTVPPYLRQQEATGGQMRDPRAPWALSIVYRAVADADALSVTPGKRLKALDWWPVETVEAQARPAFDHAALIRRAVQALRVEVGRLELPFGALPDRFTLTELQGWCEGMLGRRLDKSSFRRRLEEHALLEEVPGEMRTGAFRPAKLYRAAGLTRANAPVSRRSR